MTTAPKFSTPKLQKLYLDAKGFKNSFSFPESLKDLELENYTFSPAQLKNLPATLADLELDNCTFGNAGIKALSKLRESPVH